MNLKEYISLKKSVFILLLLFIYFSCYYSQEEKSTCILNCNPAECLILDEEKCECIEDIECLSEKFCGGDVVDCGCKEKDGGNWCKALTGDSIKVWWLYTMTDSLRDEFISTNYNPYFDRKRGYLCRYRLDHIYSESGIFEDKYSPFVSSWEFDNVIYPEKIIYKHAETSIYPFPGYCEELDLIKLTPDTLILSYYNELRRVWLFYIPETERHKW